MGALNADPGLERWNFMSQGVPGVTLFSLPSPVGGELFQAEDDIGRVPICALLLAIKEKVIVGKTKIPLSLLLFIL